MYYDIKVNGYTFETVYNKITLFMECINTIIKYRVNPKNIKVIKHTIQAL